MAGRSWERKAEDLKHGLKACFERPAMRFAFAAFIPLSILGVLWYYKYNGTFLVCVFYELTGLYCPGCGSGRALHALIRGDVLRAVDLNLFFVLAIPFLGYYFFSLYLKLILRRDILKRPFIPIWVTVAVLVLIFAYAVLRNLPGMPFELLAP